MISTIVLACTTGAVTFASLLAFEIRRRRLPVTAVFRLPALAALDLLPVALTGGLGASLLVSLIAAVASSGVIPLSLSTVSGALLCILFLPVLWFEGRRQIQFQRPTGLVFAEWLFFVAISGLLLLSFVRPHRSPALVLVYVAVLLVSGAIIATVVPPFVRKYEGLRILDRVGEAEQHPQPEYTPATPECPQPELWSMLDSQTTEVEVLDFLKTLVTTVKPKLIVETGTFLGHGTVKLAEGARENGFGRVITVEFDPDIRQRALARFEASGLSSWIESRLESSLETLIHGTIDLLYSDSHLANREAEIRRLLPQLNPQGLLVIHDASSHFKTVRDAAHRLEAEGLISMVLLPTPRGVVIAQRREGRV